MEMSDIVTLALALALGTIGEVFKNLVNAKAGDTGWRGVYYVTLRLHAIVAGLVAGLAFHGSVAIPEQFGVTLRGYALWGAYCGGLAMVGYDVFVGIVRARIKQLGERS